MTIDNSRPRARPWGLKRRCCAAPLLRLVRYIPLPARRDVALAAHDAGADKIGRGVPGGGAVSLGDDVRVDALES